MSHTSGIQNLKTTRDDKAWEIEIKAEITPEAIAEHRAHTIKEISASTKIDGFRAGHVPENVLVQHYGEQAILEHTVEHTVRHELPEILAKEKFNIVDAPQVSIDRPKPGEAVAFTARAPLAPEVKLADYKKIATKSNASKEESTVTDQEHADALNHLKRERARISHIEAGKNSEEAAEEAKKLDAKDLPELDEEFVKSLGYEDLEKFTGAVRENLKSEKEMREVEKRRAALLDALVDKSTIKYPALLKNYELDEMEARMAGDLERMGTTLDAYLTHTKKSKEDLRKDWEKSADQRAKVRLILAEIARAEKIEPDEAELSHQMDLAQKQYPQSDPSALRAHISHALRNEAVIRFLEGQKV